MCDVGYTLIVREASECTAVRRIEKKGTGLKYGGLACYNLVLEGKGTRTIQYPVTSSERRRE
jgi:hypothetical protein